MELGISVLIMLAVPCSLDLRSGMAGALTAGLSIW
jgi:hypothetical protein